jgi:hypothetical protein
MKRVSILVAVASLASLVALATAAGACDRKSGKSSYAVSFDEPVHFADRYDLRDVDFIVSTTNRKVDLLLTERGVALQLSDRVLRRIDEKERDIDEDDSRLGAIIKTAVLSSVRSVLSHSAEVEYGDIKSVDYRNGEIVIKGWDGDRLFVEKNTDNDHVMRQFSDDDARDFVRELRSRLEHERR